MVVQMFNWVHILVLLTVPAIAVGAWFLLRNKSQMSRDNFIWVLMGIVVAAYLITFIVDLTIEEYRATILERLPLHLCGLNIFIFPICFALRNSKRKTAIHIAFAYIYFVGSPGGLLGSLMPPSDIAGSTIYTYNVATYFIKHNLIFLIPIMLVVLKYYTPKFKDMLYVAITLIVLLCFMHCVNLVLSAIGGYTVNYFYTRVPDNVVLEIFWNLVPVELLYMFLLIVLLVPIFAAYYFSSKIPDFIKKSKAKRNADSSSNMSEK